jgi:tetratricopeptide (TPR) repeat protein
VAGTQRSPRAVCVRRFVLLQVLAWAGLCLAAAGGCSLEAANQNAEGVRLFRQGYYDGAAQRFQQALYVDPGNADSWYNLAATYHRVGKLHRRDADLQQAESLYYQCLQRNPNHQESYRGLAVLLADRGRSDEAFRVVQSWADRSPSLSAPRVELARLYQEAGDRDTAKVRLLEAVTLNPTDSRALAALGKLREESGDTSQALADYQRSLWQDRYQPEVAARVAALQTNVYAGQFATQPGGSRMAAGSAPTLR